jgi:hypothetical protein
MATIQVLNARNTSVVGIATSGKLFRLVKRTTPKNVVGTRNPKICFLFMGLIGRYLKYMPVKFKIIVANACSNIINVLDSYLIELALFNNIIDTDVIEKKTSEKKLLFLFFMLIEPMCQDAREAKNV